MEYISYIAIREPVVLGWRVKIEAFVNGLVYDFLTAPVVGYDEQTGEMWTETVKYVPYMRCPENV